MKNSSHRGRAPLRDLGPAGGVYEVDYILHSFVRQTKHIGAATTTRRVSSADIRPVNGYLLKNGTYALEQDDAPCCKLRKTGALWELMSDE
jgi:hypothetical protein